MAFAVIGAMACQNLQVDLFDYFGINSPAARTYGDVSILKWLLSPQNTAGFERIDVTSIPGKKRAVAFMVEEPYCFDVARIQRLCTNAPTDFTQTPKEMVYDFPGNPFRITDGAGNPLGLKIDLIDMAQYCTVDDYKWMQRQIFKVLSRFEEGVAKAISTLVIGAVGTNKAGDAITNLPIWVQSNGKNVLNPEAEFMLTQTMQDIMVNDQYAAVGGAIINKMRTFTKWAGLDAAGIDMSKVSPENPWAFYDRNFEAQLGTDFIQFAPGTMQLVNWNRYAPGSSQRSEVTDIFSNGTITMPRTGLQIDWEWTYDNQCKVWRFEPSMYLDLVSVPPGGCSTPNVNGIIRVHDCSATPLVPVCPDLPVS